MKFCDQAKIFIESGAGGAGCVSFRREKNIPFGGPDGGHGGRGGHVKIRASRDLLTLIDFRYRHHFRAPNGKQGQGRQKAGAAGKDLELVVPLGTEVWHEGTLIADLTQEGREEVLLRGGEGGRGNASFTSSTNQAPRQFGPGEPGSHLWIELKLKLMADIGLIGLPNAGKSSLLQALTHACPKVADYPFTTLTPQLGVLPTLYHDIVIADLPGLIEGAHQGKGLGHRFLGHGERCRGLLHLIEGVHFKAHGEQAYTTIRKELEAYTPGLAQKKEAIVITKQDLMTEEDLALCRKTFPQAFIISSLTGEGIPALLEFLPTFLPPSSLTSPV